MKKIILNSFLLALLGLSVSTASAQLKILSGFDKGTYHQLANDIKGVCGDLETLDTIKDKVPDYNKAGEQVGEHDTTYYRSNRETFISIKTSGGSIDNYRQLVVNRSTGMDVTFMQYDVLLYNELKAVKTATTKDNGVRILLSLGSEQIHLVVRNDAYIQRLKDLKNMRVSIGTKQMGTNITAMFIQEITGIRWMNIEFDLEKSFKMLLSDQIDAFFFVGSAPIKRLTELSNAMKYEIRLVPIEDENLTAYYQKSKIPAGVYPWCKEDINTYSVKTALITNVQGETPIKTASIRKLLTDIKDNISKLQASGHPEWNEVDFNFDGIDWKIHDVSKQVYGLQ